MTLSDFLQLLDKYLDAFVYPEATRNKERRNYITTETLLTWFLSLDNDEDYTVLEKSPDFLDRVYNGALSLPVKDAKQMRGRLDSYVFEEHTKNLSPEALASMCEEFQKKGETISPNNAPEDLTNLLGRILDDLISHPKKATLKRATIHDGVVQIGSKVFNLPPQLSVPSSVSEEEQVYVDALLTVYAQDCKKDDISLKDLENLPQIYQDHFRVQRQNYYAAESVLHQVRDTFVDGEHEFESLKEETLEGIEATLLKKYKNGFDRLQESLMLVTFLPYSKSLLARSDKNLVGPRERRGLLHMLVNDGKITWIKEYDGTI
jgi:hypothetical protein